MPLTSTRRPAAMEQTYSRVARVLGIWDMPIA